VQCHKHTAKSFPKLLSVAEKINYSRRKYSAKNQCESITYMQQFEKKNKIHYIKIADYNVNHKSFGKFSAGKLSMEESIWYKKHQSTVNNKQQKNLQ
jgi:hypothetical protein